MIAFLVTLALIAAGLFATQVLRSVDLPKYRSLIFKIYVGLAVVGAGAAGYGARGLGDGAFPMAMIATGALACVAFAQRSWHYHAIRREIDIPPHLTSTYDPKLEGPSAQAARRKTSRPSGGEGSPPAA